MFPRCRGKFHGEFAPADRPRVAQTNKSCGILCGARVPLPAFSVPVVCHVWSLSARSRPVLVCFSAKK
jgi:hypothetical protein